MKKCLVCTPLSELYPVGNQTEQNKEPLLAFPEIIVCRRVFSVITLLDFVLVYVSPDHGAKFFLMFL